MKPPAIPHDEAARLDALRRYRILDSAPEREFDELAELASFICGTPMSLVTLVDEDRQWFKARIGFADRETTRDISFCAHAILGDDILEVEDASRDERFADYPNVTGDPNIRFYAGAPLRTSDGFALGTLCVVDDVPRALTDEQRNALRILSRQAVARLELRAKVDELNELSELVDLAHDAIIVLDLEGTITLWNHGAERLYGYRSDEAVGRSASELLHSVFPESRERTYEQLLRRGEWNGELEHTAADGRAVTVASRWALRRDANGDPVAVLEINRDITLRRIAERALRESESRFRAVVQEAHEPFFALSPVGTVTEWNAEAERAFGWTRDETVGRNLLDTIVPETLRERFGAALAAFAEQGTSELFAGRFERTVLHRDGREVPVELTIWPTQVAGTTSVNVFARDISERRELEAQREAAARALEEQNARLRELDRMKDEFVSLVSHELRTPLTSITGFLDLVLIGDVGELTDEQRRFLGIVHRNAQRLIRLVSDLLLAAQVESGALRLTLGEVDAAVVVADAAEAARPSAETKGVRLEASTAGDLRIEADAGRVAQAVDNLVSNAVKFTPAGGEVTISAQPEKEGIVISVADTGVGMAEEERAQLFRRFYRTRAATEGAVPGSGLGLAISRAIAEAHGGSIDVESEEGRGSTFRLRLPRKVPEAAVSTVSET